MFKKVIDERIERNICRYGLCSFFITVALLVISIFTKLFILKLTLNQFSTDCVILLLSISYFHILLIKNGVLHKLYNKENKVLPSLIISFFISSFFSIIIILCKYKKIYHDALTFVQILELVILFLVITTYCSLLIFVITYSMSTISKKISDKKNQESDNVNQSKIKNYTNFEICSVSIIVTTIIIVLNEFLQIIDTHNTELHGILLLSPTFLSPFVLIMGIFGYVKTKSSISKLCIAIGIIMLFWIIAYFFIGTLLFGV